MAVLSVKVRTSGGEAGNHVAYVEVTGPDKKLRSYYTQKVILEKGGGKLNIPISFNDDLGLWSVNVRDVASGVTQKVDIRVTN